MMSMRAANISVLVGAVLLSFVISFGFFIRMGVVPPALLVLITMIGVGLITAGRLYSHDSGHQMVLPGGK